MFLINPHFSSSFTLGGKLNSNEFKNLKDSTLSENHKNSTYEIKDIHSIMQIFKKIVIFLKIITKI